MNTLSNLIQSEIADFFAGFGGPGEPDIQSGEAQRQLTERVLDLLRKEREAAVPVHQFIYNNPHEEGYTEWLDCNEDYFNGVPDDCRRILYTTQPARPVAVPEVWTWDQAKRFVRDREIKFPVDAAYSAVKAYCAAMLKGE